MLGHKTLRSQGLSLMYERIFPEILRREDPETFYWPASPSSGGSFDNPNDPTGETCTTGKYGMEEDPFLKSEVLFPVYFRVWLPGASQSEDDRDLYR